MNARVTEILGEAQAIMTAVEEGSTPLSRIALRARRLAQIVDDDEAFAWLRLECEGAIDPTRTDRKWNDPGAGERGLRGQSLQVLMAQVLDDVGDGPGPGLDGAN